MVVSWISQKFQVETHNFHGPETRTGQSAIIFLSSSPEAHMH